MAKSDNSMPAWGKFDEATGRIHLLEHHCADVASCFEALLEDPILEARVAAACGKIHWSALTKARLTYLAYLHDFGKVNTGFQFKVPRLDGIRPRRGRDTGHIGLALVCCESDHMVNALNLEQTLGSWGPGAIPLLLAVLAHHGRPAARPQWLVGKGRALWRPIEGYSPQQAACSLVERGREWFPNAFGAGAPLPDQPALAHLFAGLVALADQIGSNEEFFKYEDARDPNYIDKARRRAREAVSRLGFSRRSWRIDAPKPTIQSLFYYEAPRPVQRVVSEASLDYPLLVVESETGSGKTEAAILRFANLWREGLVDGLYFALPTRSAAKQLHRRVADALNKLFPRRANVETVLAVPGYIRAGVAEGRRLGGFRVFWEDSPDEELRQARWAAESSRKYLSSPAAVGTVDQVLLAGLRVKWAHLRAASLARSLLVVDEVHASDAYMSELLNGVLRAHLAIGGHALVMSATLGSKARQGLLMCPQPLGFKAATAYPYPVMSLTRPGESPSVTPIDGGTKPKEVSIRVCELLTEPDQIAHRAIAAARAGAKVLVIRNTVLAGTAVFNAICNQNQQRFLLNVNGVSTLHHSRFAVEDRVLLDRAVERELCKNTTRTAGRIVVGTQTLEQSLDLDADFLITDICPVDVLLQRIGRLHRHQRDNRPEGSSMPHCEVLVPTGGLNGAIQGRFLRYGLGMGKTGGVYPNVVCLEATCRLILRLKTWVIPSHCRMLVEEATHPNRLNVLADQLGQGWNEHLRQIEGCTDAQSVFARLHTLNQCEPFNEDYIFPDIDQRVRTRLGEDGPRVELSESAIGPFHEPVRTFNLPAHMFRGNFPDIDAIESATLTTVAGGRQVLKVGDHRFTYGADGVHRMAIPD